MAVYFFDSSGIVKRYVDETGTARVVELTHPEAAHRIYLGRIDGALNEAAKKENIVVEDPNELVIDNDKDE